MAIQYSGGPIVNVSWVQTLGTRRELVDKIVLELGNAGWSTISGGGTGDVTLESATTPQGLKMRVRVYDPGSGNCARVSIMNPSGSLQSQDHYLLPNAGSKTWQFVGCKYQMCIWTLGATAGREHLGFGVLWIPSFLEGVITTVAAWIGSNSSSDTDGSVQVSFRTRLTVYGSARSAALVDTYLLNIPGGTVAQMRLFPTAPGLLDFACILWHDDSRFLMDPLLGFGVTGSAEIAKLRGMLWNAVILSGDRNADSTYTFDGHNWIALTASNAGSSSYLAGTLLLATS